MLSLHIFCIVREFTHLMTGMKVIWPGTHISQQILIHELAPLGPSDFKH